MDPLANFLKELKGISRDIFHALFPPETGTSNPPRALPPAYQNLPLPYERQVPQGPTAPRYAEADHSGSRISTESVKDLTQFPNWDWRCFRAVLISLALNRPGCYIPSVRRPDSIFLDGLRETMDELLALSRSHEGRETSRAVFVDLGRVCLVISGRTNIGTFDRTSISLSPEPGRENRQLPVLTIHVHPKAPGSQGLSDIDYVVFLTDERQIAMMICWEDGVLLALKTTATASNLGQASVEQRMKQLYTDYLSPSRPYLDPKWAVFSFNKAVCMEFGLTLYEAYTPDSLLARRIEVTR